MQHELTLKIFYDRFPEIYSESTAKLVGRNIDDIINEWRQRWARLNGETRRLRGFILIKIEDPLAAQTKAKLFSGVLSNITLPQDAKLSNFPYYQGEIVGFRFFDNNERYHVKIEAFIVDLCHPEDDTVVDRLIDT